MSLKPMIAAALVLSIVPAALAAFHVNCFEVPRDGVDPAVAGYVVNDVYVNTAGTGWMSSFVYCELGSGRFYQSPHDTGNSALKWEYLPSEVVFDSWVAPGVSLYTEEFPFGEHPFGGGDPANVTAYAVFLTDLVDGACPPWEGLGARFLFSPDANGMWAFKVSAKGSDPVLYSGYVDEGRINDFGSIEGDLNFDGAVNGTDLDLVRANWGSDSVILGDLYAGDPSCDGRVTSADLDIIRANWRNNAAVPEPGVGLLILGIAFVVLAGCRTRAAFAE